ncbi:14252_t:CDS:2 [Funneliformis geosporum]|nr:14252_t:CDS:2 [Funneliformis geosporum]
MPKNIGEEIENTQTKERKSDKYIKVTLTGSLNLNDFANLEGLVFSPIGYPLSDNRIDNLIIDDCKNLKNVEFYSKALTLTNNPRLEEVDCSECESAYHLILVNNPKLKSLRIDNSKKVTIDLLNLPENLERVYCEGTNLTEKLKGYDKQEKIKARDKDNNVKDITFTYYDYRS